MFKVKESKHGNRASHVRWPHSSTKTEARPNTAPKPREVRHNREDRSKKENKNAERI